MAETLAVEPQVSKTAARFRALYTAAIYDILEEFGYPNQCLDLGIKPLDKSMKVAGPAFTIAGHPDPVTDEEYVTHGHQKLIDFEYIGHMYPGCVVAISAGGEERAGHWGELMSTAAKAAGAVGAVMDGGCRDGQLVLDIPEWSLFARFWSPIEGRLRYRVRNYQKPIAMRGALTNQVRVDPGDWIVGDMDGVLSIPRNMADKVLHEAERRKLNESKAREDIRNGDDIKVVLDRYGTF